MKNKTIILSCCLLWCSIIDMQAQSNTVASGGEATGSGGTVSYTIGQVAYFTETGSTGTVNHGVHQPYEIFVYVGLEEAKGITLQCFAYPNPTTEYVKLKVENHKTKNMTYQLYNIKGELFENSKIEGKETNIDMSKLIAAMYFLKITYNYKEIKTFKIIKN